MRNLYPTLRRLLRHGVLSAMGAGAKPSCSIHILNGHTLSKLSKEGYDSSDAAAYGRLLCQLARECDFITLPEAVSMIEEHAVVARPKVAFTFDDGFLECYDYIAPLLEKYGTRGAFFINPNFATAADNGDETYIAEFTNHSTLSPGRRPMTWVQIQDLARRGHTIGAHTMNHTRLNSSDIQALTREVVDCRPIIEEKLGAPCEYFAWTYGRLEDISETMVGIACSTYKYVFSQGDHRNYHSFDGRVINRRHAEPWWPLSHVNFFLKHQRNYR